MRSHVMAISAAFFFSGAASLSVLHNHLVYNNPNDPPSFTLGQWHLQDVSIGDNYI